MDEALTLSPSTQAILDEITSYHRSRLYDFEKRANRRQRAQEMDGQYSLTRLLSAQAENDVARLAPYEKAVSDHIAEEAGRSPQPGYAFVPVHQRDLTAGAAGAGGYLVGTETAPGATFATHLRAASVVQRLGVPHLAVTGHPTVPGVTADVTTSWLQSEGTPLTESQFTFATTAGTPKTVGAYTQASRRLLHQASPVAQGFLLREMARATAATVDAAFLNGTGASGQPTGLLNVSGVGSVSGASLTWGGALDAIETVETANGLVAADAGAWAIAPNAARLLRARERAAGSGFIMGGGRISDFPATVSNSVPAATAVFGDWSAAVLLEWGVLEVGADPYGATSELFKAGLVGIRARWTVDVVVLTPASFCKVEGIS